MKDVYHVSYAESDTLAKHTILYLHGTAVTPNDDTESYLLWQRSPVKIQLFNPYYVLMSGSIAG